ncbi:MAG: NUDIX hydrolase [Oscillospiraceae bacterium]|nr:NUDIX hydrolase [Oscillospiraceae bacterium]
MSRIKGVKRLTENRFLNLYELDARQRDGKAITYYVASRAKSMEKLKAVEGHRRADGVIMYGVYGEQKDRIVLIRQYRYPLGDYIYEFPAGLVEPGEDVREAGIREMFEETGLTFVPRDGGDFERPFFTTVGMTDESCTMVFGYCQGTPTNANQEAAEDIQVVLADRAECRRILKEENVAIMPAYMIMHFLSSQGDPLDFLKSAEF